MDVLLTVDANTDVAEEVRWWRENYVVENGRVVVLAVWGSVRGILPALRARGARLP